jgi:hypothetical protein
MTERGSIDQRHLLVRRSASQLLNRRIAGGPEVAVRALLAVQAQDRSAWRLALRARVDDITADDVNRALSDKRSLVVAWLNRGTLHLVCSEDYPWLLALAAPTQVVANGHRLAQEPDSGRGGSRGGMHRAVPRHRWPVAARSTSRATGGSRDPDRGSGDRSSALRRRAPRRRGARPRSGGRSPSTQHHARGYAVETHVRATSLRSRLPRRNGDRAAGRSPGPVKRVAGSV